MIQQMIELADQFKPVTKEPAHKSLIFLQIRLDSLRHICLRITDLFLRHPDLVVSSHSAQTASSQLTG